MKPRESSTVLLRTRRAVAEGTLKKAAYRSKKELTMDERTADLALRLLRKDMNLRYTGFYHVFAYVREWEAGSAFLENIVQVLEECGLSKRFSVDQSREPRRNTTHELSMMYVYLTQSTPNTQNLNSTDMPTPILFTSQKEYEIGAIPDEKEFEFNNQHKISLRAEFDVEKDYMSYISVHRHKIHVSDDESSLIRRIESHETIYSCRECASHAIHEIDCFVLPADQGPTVMSASDEYPKRMKICIDGQGQDWPLSEMDQQDPFHELSWDLISNPSQARWGLESSRGMPFDSSPNRTERSLFEQPTILTLEVGRYGLECHEIEVQGTVREVLQRVHEYYDHEMPFDHCDCEPNELRNHRCMGDLFFEGIRDNQVLFGT
ncbi:hypothetical protein KVT40_002206 [Elsinoe batatas]|uniref:Uncharacterized protein n=1 Tax=Elsinoe batatas TaxID=2601811 RepID=A0A8K0PJJ4_9PEZI|nr:hypothetical protein KVT40_002206 [Elsinoe batatas]